MTTQAAIDWFITQPVVSLINPLSRDYLTQLLNDPVTAEATLRDYFVFRTATAIEVAAIQTVTTRYIEILARIRINWTSELELFYLGQAVITAYQTIITALNPSILFRMDESASPAVNHGSLGTLFNGTVTNMTFDVVTGLPIIPKAYGYNGSTSLLATASNAALAALEWTAAALVNVASAGEGSIGYFTELQTAASALVGHYRFNGNLTTLLSQIGDSAGGAKSTTTTPGISAGAWVWVFCSYHADTKQPYLYRSVSHILTEYGYSFRAPLTGIALSAAKLTVGNNGGSTGTMNGSIAQFMLFPRVLTTDEMQLIITASEV